MAYKIKIFISIAALTTLTSTIENVQAAAVEATKNVRLINIKNNFTLVEFIGAETIFHDPILEKEMKERGVLIPPSLRGLYNEKSAVRLGEAEFQKAFKEIFALNIFNQHNYKWEE